MVRPITGEAADSVIEGELAEPVQIPQLLGRIVSGSAPSQIDASWSAVGVTAGLGLRVTVEPLKTFVIDWTPEIICNKAARLFLSIFNNFKI